MPKRAVPADYKKSRLWRTSAPKRRKRPLVVPGVTRRSGFYGRYRGMNPEKKFLDTNITDNDISAILTAVNLTIVPQDDTQSGRVGRKINVKNIRIKNFVSLTAKTDAALTSENYWMMVVQDTQCNGASFASTDLLVSDAPASFRNLSNQERFKVLWSKFYSFNVSGMAPSGAAFVTGENTKTIKCNINCDIPIEYDNSATTGAVTTQKSNTLWFVTLSQTGSVLAGVGNCRIRYYDN